MVIVNKDDRGGCRSLVCDQNGIIIAEQIYRCMICEYLSESISAAQRHYQIKHIDAIESSDFGDTSPPGRPLAMGDDDEMDTDEKPNIDDGQPESGDELAQSDRATLTIKVPSLRRVNGNGANHESTSDEDRGSTPEPTQLAPGLRQSLNSYGTGKGGGGFQAAPELGEANGSSRGGFVTCAVCNITKFYASVQRRYGQFTCMGCAKFFGRFLLKPRRYCCPNLGSCLLDQSPRCKACLLLACINTYNIDDKRMQIVNQNRPLRRAETAGNAPVIPATTIVQRAPLTSTSLRQPRTLVTQRAAVLKRNALLNSSTRRTGQPGLQGQATESTGWSCRKCDGCRAPDCGECMYCADKPKFGGPNTLKKKCLRRRCTQPQSSPVRGLAVIKK